MSCYNKGMFTFLRKYLPEIILTVFVVSYSIYFSLLTINRYEKLYAHYFDLGIMHQTVYNTYKSIQTADPSRFLEMTNPHNSTDQVKRMSIHNDAFLALLAPFYFIHEGPETILFLQTIVLALGSVFVFLIAKKVLKDLPYSSWLSLVLSISYLLYSPLEKANKFDFHAVTLATTLLLGMFYYWQEKKYKTSLLFVGLSLLTKEQVGMTTALFGVYVIFDYVRGANITIKQLRSNTSKQIKHLLPFLKKNKNIQFALITILVSLIWIVLSMFVIIPLARGGEHFASKYYDHIKEQPWQIFTYPFRSSNIEYLVSLFGPTGFLALFSPLYLLIVLPEFGINVLSSNANMTNTYFHYESVITPFIFIATIYSVYLAYSFISSKFKQVNKNKLALVIGAYILGATMIYSYLQSPLPYSKQQDMYPWRKPPQKYYSVIAWKNFLKDDQLKVSTTGRIAPHFTSRQYFYDFSWKYSEADYIVVEKDDALNGFLKNQTRSAYNKLQSDKEYIKIYDEEGIEVYSKL